MEPEPEEPERDGHATSRYATSCAGRNCWRGNFTSLEGLIEEKEISLLTPAKCAIAHPYIK